MPTSQISPYHNQNITLSNSNLRGKWQGGSSTHNTIICTPQLATNNKWYWEVTVDTLSGTTPTVCGVMFFNHSPSGYGGNDSVSYGITQSGGVWYNAVQVSTVAAVASTNVVSIALDLVNNTIWFRTNAGNWNNNVVNNPATNTGGLSIASLMAAGYGLHPYLGFYFNNDQSTINFGDTTFAQTAPSGFNAVNTWALPSVITNTIANRSATFVTYGGSNTASVSGTVQKSTVPQNTSAIYKAFYGTTIASGSPEQRSSFPMGDTVFSQAHYGAYRIYSPATSLNVVSGQVREMGIPVAGRNVYLYDQATGSFIGSAVSSNSGNFSINAMGKTSVFAVAVDEPWLTIIYDQLVPVPLPINATVTIVEQNDTVFAYQTPHTTLAVVEQNDTLSSSIAINYTPITLTITNPDAEATTMTGWTQDSAGPAIVINTTGSGYPGPHSGSYYFEAAAANTASVFSQIINVPSTYNTSIDSGALAVDFTAYHGGCNPNGDAGALILECQDSGGSVLASFTASSFTVITALLWCYRSAKMVIPANTRKFRIGTTNTRASGTILDSYWDDFGLVLTQNLSSWTNPLSTGNRSASITVTATNISAGAGSPTALVDGSQSNSYWWSTTAGDGSAYLTFDFGIPKIVDAFKWYQDVTNSQGVWRFEGSTNNTSWTQIGSDFTLSGDVASGTLTNDGGYFYFTNNTLYRYYRLRHISGTRSGTPWLREIDFRIN